MWFASRCKRNHVDIGYIVHVVRTRRTVYFNNMYELKDITLYHVFIFWFRPFTEFLDTPKFGK